MVGTKNVTKTIGLKINIDDSHLQKIDKEIKSLSVYDIFKDNKEILDQFKEVGVIKEKLSKAQTALKELEDVGLTSSSEYEELLKSQAELTSALNKLTDANKKGDKDGKKTKKDFMRKDGTYDREGYKMYKSRQKEVVKNNAIDAFNEKVGEWKQKLINMAGEAVTKLKDFFVDTMKSAFEDIKKMQAADSQGLYANKQTREENETYGLSDSEGYGLRKALERLGQSMQDYQDGELNEKQYEHIKKLAEVEQQKYEEAKDSGVLDNIAESKEAFENMKEQIKMTVIRFIVDHGETIMEILKGIFTVIEAIFKGLTALVGFFKVDDGQNEAQTAKNVNSIIYGSTTTNRTVNNNVNISNTMHAQNNNITSSQQLSVQGQKNQLQIMRALEV